MNGEMNVDLVGEEINTAFRECRKSLVLNEAGTNFDSASHPPDGLDEMRLREYKREVLKVMIAGSPGSPDRRLYEKYEDIAKFMATSVRVVGTDGKILDIGFWSNLSQPEWALAEPLKTAVNKATEIIKSGQFTAETLFVSLAKAQEAVGFAQSLAQRGYDPQHWQELCQDLGVEAEFIPQGVQQRLVLPEMEQVAYGTVASGVIEASAASGETHLLKDLHLVAASIANIEKNVRQAALAER